MYQWPRQWCVFLSWTDFWYNTTYHVSIGMTYFKALYDRSPLKVPIYQIGQSPVHEVDQALMTRDELLGQLKKNLAAAVNRMKHVADRHRKEVVFKEGDMVFLKLQPHHQSSVFKRAH